MGIRFEEKYKTESAETMAILYLHNGQYHQHNNDDELHIPPTSSHPLAVQQKVYLLTNNTEEYSDG